MEKNNKILAFEEISTGMARKNRYFLKPINGGENIIKKFGKDALTIALSKYDYDVLDKLLGEAIDILKTVVDDNGKTPIFELTTEIDPDALNPIYLSKNSTSAKLTIDIPTEVWEFFVHEVIGAASEKTGMTDRADALNLLGTLNALLGASVNLLTMCKHDVEKED